MVQLITVTTKNMDSGIRHFQDQRQILQNPDMSWAVRGAARVWDRNFKSEGSMVGGWHPLSEWTQRVRRARGYGAEHPILRQTGTLHRVAIRSLLDARGAKTSTGSGVSMNFRHMPKGRAHLRIVGEKVKNHYGYRRTPGRPFWFVNDDVTSEAARSLERWYAQELGRLG